MRSNSIPSGNGPLSNAKPYTVGELLTFIPPAISAQGLLPMDQTVLVPVTPNNPSEVKLSTLYQVCPSLFAAEITPLNDSVVPLPSKIGDPNVPTEQPQQPNPPSLGSESPSPFADAVSSPLNPSYSPEGRQSQPFSTPAVQENVPSTKEIVPEPDDNPFWSQPGSSNPQSSSSSPQHTPSVSSSFSPQNPSLASPMDGPMDGFFPGGNADMIGNLVPPIAPPATSQPTSPPAEAEAFPQPGPSSTDAKEGFLDDGNPFLSETANPSNANEPSPFDGGPDFSTLFSKEAQSDEVTSVSAEREDLPASPPSTEGMGFSSQSGSVAEPGEHSGGGSIFGLPSANDSIQLPAPVADESDDDDDFSAFIPPTADELTMPDIPALREAEKKISPEGSIDPPAEQFPAMTASSGFVDSIGDIPSFDIAAPVPTGVPIASTSTEDTFPLPSVSEDFPLQSEQHLDADRPPVSDLQGTAPPLEDAPIQDLELRAVFGTNESFTLRKIATLIVCMPGVSACAIATPDKALQASREEGATIGEEAATLAKTVKELAKLTGSPDANTFTVNTDKGVLSIFVGGNSYLTVQHDPGGFEPGVQEKLILVSRSLDTIRE